MPIGYYLFLATTVSYFLHLTARIPVLGLIRFDLVLDLVTMVFAIIELMGRHNERNIIKPETTRRLLILCAYIIITIPFVEWPGSVVRNGLENYLKVIIFYLFSVVFITDEKRLKNYITVFIGCQIVRILESLYLHVTEGYWGSKAFTSGSGGTDFLNRLAGSPYDVVNPNQFAWIIITVTPFIYFLWWKSNSKIKKFFTLGLIPFGLYAAALTGSRSGLLSFIVLIIGIAWVQKKSIKTIFAMAVIFLPVFLIVGTMISPKMVTRYQSIYDSQAEGHGSVTGRIKGVKRGLILGLHRPIVGHGLNTSIEATYHFGSGRKNILQPPHNLYIEIMIELGIVGLILFMLYVFAMWKCLREAKASLDENLEENRQLIDLMTGIQAWMIMDLFYSLSCFGLSSWEWYLFGGLTAVCYRLAMQRAQEKEDLVSSDRVRVVAN